MFLDEHLKGQKFVDQQFYWAQKTFWTKTFFRPKAFFHTQNVFQNLFQKIWGLKKIVGLRQFWVRRKFEFEIFFGSNKISGLKTLGPNKILCLEKVLSKNILVHKNYDSKKIGSKKFGQNWTSNSWDIAYMDKCHQGICCQDKCHHNSWHLLNMVQRSYL